jgi:hypothetical protein
MDTLHRFAFDFLDLVGGASRLGPYVIRHGLLHLYDFSI